jgi:O-antigen/teichoic acid export membrane protein
VTLKEVYTSEDPTHSVSGKIVAKNSIYNLLGYGLPLIIAIGLIPPLIDGLGEERFGILSLGWVIIGYFSFLDFGIGRALTKFISEKIGVRQYNEIPQIFWTSFLLMLIISSSFTILIFFFANYFVQDIFKISKEIREETLYAFYVLALTIPIVTTAAGFRGVLEAYQKFGVINIIRVILGVFTFLTPVLCLIFTKNLFWIVLALSIVRVIVWILYLIKCFQIDPKIKIRKVQFEIKLIKLVLSMSSWMTLSNVIGPILIHLDRFLIGGIISAVAITYYSTPYEVVSKLLLIPGALTGVLFPAFSLTYINNPELTKNLFFRGVKFIFILLYPVVLMLVTFAHEGINLWLGSNFADKSSFVLQMLAIGVILNSLAYVPFSYLQGIGKPKIPALVNLIELPFYIFAMWIAIKKWGINGVAVIWLLRIVIDTIILFAFTKKMSLSKILTPPNLILTLLFSSSLVFPLIISSFIIKILFVVILLMIFAVLCWKVFLQVDEKKFIAETLGLISINTRKSAQ